MILALIACTSGLGITGWLHTTDHFWRMAWLSLLHQRFTWSLLTLVVLHVAGGLFSSICLSENLIAAMLIGR